MSLYIEKQNFIEDPSDIQDKLRGEIGYHYTKNANGSYTNKSFEGGKILSYSISDGERNDILLFPKYNHIINIYGKEGEFRDQGQWKDHVAIICKTSKVYTDHIFEIGDYEYFCKVSSSYHLPEYEDVTKVFNTNQLLNYNLFHYPHSNDVEKIKQITALKTVFDSPNDVVPNSLATIRKAFLEYQDRIVNYSGSLYELDRKQRNIFMFNGHNPSDYRQKAMPYMMHSSIEPKFQTNLDLTDALRETRVNKFILQMLKNDITFQMKSYKSGDSDRALKTHDLTNLIINYKGKSFVEGDDELFLHLESDLNSNHISNRFVNQVDRIFFLQEYRKIMKQYGRDYKEVLSCNQSKKFRIGYKVEKYYLNDVTTPVQTYYIASYASIAYKLDFFDSQMKFGDKYIYKFTDLIAVLGSYYSYSSLYVTNEDGLLESQDGTVRNYGDGDVSKKYRARLKVSVSPSFQVVEIPIFSKEIAAWDRPTLPPEIYFYNESGKKNNVGMLFRPNVNSEFNAQYLFKPIGTSDDSVVEKLELSKDNLYGTVFSSKYFNGRYEIYRMDSPPKKISDFENNLLVEVDQVAEILSKKNTTVANKGERHNYTLDYPNASFEDVVLPHKKYYYLFRTLTYHGAPSNYSPIYELELLQDSNDTKIVVNEYKIPQQKDYTYVKEAKRLLRITPNFEQLLFNENHDSLESALQDIGILEEDKLFNGNIIGKQFKIRITSKHTGKKMDINLRFKLKKTNFPS